MKPIVSSTLILNALSVWNDFQISLIIAQKEEVRTIPLTQYFFFGQYSIKLNMAFAAFVLAMIPILLLYLLMQKHIIGGVRLLFLKKFESVLFSRNCVKITGRVLKNMIDSYNCGTVYH